MQRQATPILAISASGMKARRYGGEQARTPHPGKASLSTTGVSAASRGVSPSEASLQAFRRGHSVAKAYYMLHLTFRTDIAR